MLVVATFVGWHGGAPAAAAPGDELQFESRRIDVHEHAGRVVVRIVRPAVSSLQSAEAAVVSIDRSATAGDDYSPLSTRVRLDVGETVATIVVFIVDDSVEEPTEMFVLRLTGDTGPSHVIDEAYITVFDDDTVRAASTRSPSAPTVGAANAASRSPAASGQAAAASPPAQPSAARSRATRAARPAPGATQRPQARVTPFELRTREGEVPASVPVPDHASPVVAASILAMIALGRVSAELWYRYRIRDI